MRSINTAMGIASVLLLGACARQVGSATVTSASDSPSSAPTTPADAAALRLADEMCAREAACNRVGDGARYRTEEACLSDQSARAPAQLSRWTCTPVATQPGFEECLAAIRGERCETSLTRLDQINPCTSGPVCGR